jgi:hypothetical protein
MLSGHFWTHGFLQRNTFRIDASDVRETGSQKRFSVSDATGYQAYGHGT